MEKKLLTQHVPDKSYDDKNTIFIVTSASNKPGQQVKQDLRNVNDLAQNKAT